MGDKTKTETKATDPEIVSRQLFLCSNEWVHMFRVYQDLTLAEEDDAPRWLKEATDFEEVSCTLQSIVLSKTSQLNCVRVQWLLKLMTNKVQRKRRRARLVCLLTDLLPILTDLLLYTSRLEMKRLNSSKCQPTVTMATSASSICARKKKTA